MPSQPLLNLLCCLYRVSHPSASLCREIMSSPPPSHKGLAPSDQSEAVAFIYCLGRRYGVVSPTAKLCDNEAFFAVRNPVGFQINYSASKRGAAALQSC